MIRSKHKDILIRIIVGILGASLVAYIVQLFINGLTTISNQGPTVDLVLLILLALSVVALMIHVIIKPLIQNKIRLTIAIIGLIYILLAHYTLIDTIENGIYLADLIKVWGVFIFLGGATGYIIPSDVSTSIQESKVEIIEA